MKTQKESKSSPKFGVVTQENVAEEVQRLA